MKALWCTLLTVGICLLSIPPGDASSEEEIDFTTIGTQRILEAKHIIVGEITSVSFVFQFSESQYSPLSFVTIRLGQDSKQEIGRVEKQEVEREDKTDKDNSTLTFVQNGGPNPDGTITQIAGVHVFQPGERVFLYLAPTIHPIEQAGQKADNFSPYIHGWFPVKQRGKTVDENIIQQGWQGLDITVSQMTRIVRATLKQPEQMRTLERRMNALGRTIRPQMSKQGPVQMPPDARLDIVMGEVTAIEKELNLPPLNAPQN
ncbi:hypothetical protein HYR99_30610 [Candidatus Poribacteria bacterium]|nr:hypothetical protein [Candidatus Poribacteria bacterium]